MSSEEIYCVKCGNRVEETLLLACDHNLCLPCASEKLSREERGEINKIQSVSCDICKIQTMLDNATAMEIRSCGSSKKNGMITDSSPKIQIQLKNYNESLNLSSVSRMNSNNLSFANNNLTTNKKEYCKEHGEELSYFCFDCVNRCICSECVVHGTHKNHDVMNVKKAYPVIAQKTEDLIYYVQSKIQDLSAASNGLELKKKEMVNTTSMMKNEIIKGFEEIRMKLKKKENEILNKSDIMLQENLQELNTYLRILQSKIISLNKLVDSISNNLMRKDEVTLLNFYSENSSSILESSEIGEIPNLPDFNTLNNMKVTIDQTAFDNILNAMNAVHLEITSMKGFDVDINKKNYDSQVFARRRNMYGMNSDRFLSTTSANQSYDSKRNNMNASFKPVSNLQLDEIPERNKYKLI